MPTTKMQKAVKAKAAAAKSDGYYILIDGAKSQPMSKADALQGAEETHKSDGVPTAVFRASDDAPVKAFGKQADKPATKALKEALQQKRSKTKAAPAAKAANKAPRPGSDTIVGKLIEVAKKGATTAQLAEVSGWKNAGWNTIMASLAKRHSLKLKIAKQTQEGSKRQINVFHLAP